MILFMVVIFLALPIQTFLNFCVERKAIRNRFVVSGNEVQYRSGVRSVRFGVR